MTCRDAYGPFTPSDSGQRSLPTYYRGCWHVVSRSLFIRYLPCYSLIKEVYNPKTFIPHAVSLHQTFVHCAIFLAAASRRSGGRVSVPLCPFVLSHRVPVLGLVSSYLTNYLIGRKPLPKRYFNESKYLSPIDRNQWDLRGIRPDFSRLSPASGQVTYVLLSRLLLSRSNESDPYRSTCMH